MNTTIDTVKDYIEDFYKPDPKKAAIADTLEPVYDEELNRYRCPVCNYYLMHNMCNFVKECRLNCVLCGYSFLCPTQSTNKTNT